MDTPVGQSIDDRLARQTRALQEKQRGDGDFPESAEDAGAFTIARQDGGRDDQAEAWQVADASPETGGFAASIPAVYTGTTFPLQYYFELRGAQRADLFPGLAGDLANQPYFVTRRKTA
jgi:hypothetical protein